MNGDLLKYTLNSLKQRKLRSGLTILSILIGIAAVFTLVSFGEGLKSYVNDAFQGLGSDKLIVQAKGFGPPGSGSVVFKEEDLDYFKRIKGISEAAGLMMNIGEVKYKDGKPRYIYVLGMPTGSEYKLAEESMGLEVVTGRPFRSNEKGVVILGHNYQIPDKMFKEEIKLNDKIMINNEKLQVIGFMKEIGNPSDDSQVFVSIDTFNVVFNKEDNGYGFIALRTSKGVKPSDLVDIVADKYRRHKNQKVGQEDFYVQTFEDLLKTFTSIIDVLNGVLLLIALISVIVAAVNIINTMYTAVLERTKEIGIMKAIGATNNEILFVFISESGLLGLFGGVLGIFLGFILSKIGEFFAINAGLSMLKPAFPLWLIFGCLLFAFLVGAVSGILPAKQAAKLNPVDSLRYE